MSSSNCYSKSYSLMSSMQCHVPCLSLHKDCLLIQSQSFKTMKMIISPLALWPFSSLPMLGLLYHFLSKCCFSTVASVIKPWQKSLLPFSVKVCVYFDGKRCFLIFLNSKTSGCVEVKLDNIICFISLLENLPCRKFL